jgi:hypothetical protein
MKATDNQVKATVDGNRDDKILQLLKVQQQLFQELANKK